MPDALELLTTRRSFKAVELAGPPPSAAEIDTLLTVASRVPDHGKLAPWRFIVFEGEAREGSDLDRSVYYQLRRTSCRLGTAPKPAADLP